ncbi:hypothetical protein BDZ97DRAFT_1845689 [Flammula alnicola]|nr:hypothetical protein BDZ97DRAFT_1845689 [Flammula alnicola]
MSHERTDTVPTEVDTVPLCPVQDCDLAVDVILRSSDGERFGAHSLNLQQYSDGFPIAESVTLDGADENQPILSEDAETLRLMLHFMHHTRQPDLNSLEFKTLASLAEGVEKYFIYSAMGLCYVYMKLAVDKYPLEVLSYSIKHDYPELINNAAPLTVGISASEIEAEAARANLHDSFSLTWASAFYHFFHCFRFGLTIRIVSLSRALVRSSTVRNPASTKCWLSTT